MQQHCYYYLKNNNSAVVSIELIIWGVMSHCVDLDKNQKQYIGETGGIKFATLNVNAWSFISLLVIDNQKRWFCRVIKNTTCRGRVSFLLAVSDVNFDTGNGKRRLQRVVVRSC